MAGIADESVPSEHDAVPDTHSVNSVEHPRALISRNAADAALARSIQLQETELEGMLSPDLRLPFYRCLDALLSSPLSNEVERARSIATLSTLELLLSNALHKGVSGPMEAKYLQIKLSNPAIRSKLGLDLKQHTEGTGAPALDWLYLCGWRHSVKDFQEYCSFPAVPSTRRLEELRTGLHLLSERLAREREQAELRETRKKLAQADEDGRKERALQQYKEDRQIKKDRDLRGKPNK